MKSSPRSPGTRFDSPRAAGPARLSVEDGLPAHRRLILRQISATTDFVCV
jgi:hypothetical protein